MIYKIQKRKFKIKLQQQISPVYLAQSYYDIPKKLRLNCSHIILYPPNEANHRQLLSKEYRFNQNVFDKLDKYDFLFIDKEKKTVKKTLMKNPKPVDIII